MTFDEAMANLNSKRDYTAFQKIVKTKCEFCRREIFVVNYSPSVIYTCKHDCMAERNYNLEFYD